MSKKSISGFSKLSKEEKVQWLTTTFFSNNHQAQKTLEQYWQSDTLLQNLHDDFVENTLSNYYLPYAIAPNFLINQKTYAVPMVIEESSVVAAASMVAKFWSTRGGFKTTVIATEKVGQIHFMYEGAKEDLENYFASKKTDLFFVTEKLTQNMRKRGGGIKEIRLVDATEKLNHYYQLYVTFETADSMGANFINSCLETIAQHFKNESIQIVMSILSNYVPNCLVRAEVSCNADDLYPENSLLYAEQFIKAMQIASVDSARAVTHNKGIMNGIDAVVIATGNDFRAIEACAHAYAARSGNYKALTQATIEDGLFKCWIEIPLALGTVGGLTSLHPLSKFSLQLLDNPTAKELMQITAAAGLAQNFAAIRALTTTGIQKGHMKMHLTNIIKQLGANEEEKDFLINYFENRTVTHNEVVEAYHKLRG